MLARFCNQKFEMTLFKEYDFVYNKYVLNSTSFILLVNNLLIYAALNNNSSILTNLTMLAILNTYY
jgi:hypothetical protein